MRVALLGLGTVGQGVDTILRDYVEGIEVARVLRLPQDVHEPRETSNYDDIVNDETIDCVVEVMGGLEPAHTFILKALRAGKHVVTANKAVVAANMEEFARAADESGSSLFVEATCGGGIPWIAGINKARRIDKITSFSGILNGTTNFIIDQMRKSGQDFDEALSRAQELGYAERDPSADIDGIDVANKTAISASLAFGCLCPLDFPVFGLRNLTKADMNLFAYEGYGVKLLGRGVATDEGYACVVEPTLVPSDSLEANVPDNYNIATLEGYTIGTLKFYGQGAGSLPTGNAIVQDLIDCSRGHRQRWEIHGTKTVDPSLLVGDYVVRASYDAMPQGGSTFGAGCRIYKGLTANDAHAMMADVLANDPKAFMACIPQTTKTK